MVAAWKTSATRLLSFSPALACWVWVMRFVIVLFLENMAESLGPFVLQCDIGVEELHCNDG
jgi:hypothetical protein